MDWKLRADLERREAGRLIDEAERELDAIRQTMQQVDDSAISLAPSKSAFGHKPTPKIPFDRGLF